MLDLLIQNALIIDGTGKPAFRASLGVADGKIIRIGSQIELTAERTIDAVHLCLVPGFIDPHTHSDTTLLVEPRAESKVYQGVTTEVIANCGSSPAPLIGPALSEAQQDSRDVGLDINWRLMGEYLQRLRTQGIAVNVVPLVGHNTVRACVLGYDDVQPTPAQQAEMEKLVDEALQEGARGISTGLYYPPGYYAKTEEVIGLAKVVARHGGIYATHMRSESDLIFEAIDEAFRIGREAGVRLEISHLKLEGYRNFDGLERLVSKLEEGAISGLSLGCDQYPYTASSTWLAAILPYWAQVGGAKGVAKRVSDPTTRDLLRKDWQEHQVDWEERSGVRDWSDILVTDVPAQFPDLAGKRIPEIALEMGKEPLEAALDLIAMCEGQVGCVFFDQDEDNVRALIRHPLVAVGSDGVSMSPHGVLGRGKPHPRSYGTFPRVLAKYVREEKALTLEQAIRKMTSLTAERFGLHDRGVVAEGKRADLVLFERDQVADRATFTDPHQFAAGIPYVMVNGTLVIDAGKHTGALPGRVL